MKIVRISGVIKAGTMPAFFFLLTLSLLSATLSVKSSANTPVYKPCWVYKLIGDPPGGFPALPERPRRGKGGENVSVNIYVRATKLTDVVGRVDYATSPERQQEKLIGFVGNTDKAFWNALAEDCQKAFTVREGDACCEARELIIALPNKIGEMSDDERQRMMEKLSDFLKEKTGTENLLAMHDSHGAQNDKEGNWHIHAILAERVLLDEPDLKIAERNLFFDENGRRRYKKADILDEDGSLRNGCRIVPKGTVLEERRFSEKVAEMKDKGWLYDMKKDMATWINKELRPDEQRTVYDKGGPYLPQVHVGKGMPEEKSKVLGAYNKLVKTFNRMVREGQITEEQAKNYKTQIMLAPERDMELVAVLDDVLQVGQTVGKKVGGERTSIGPDEKKKRQLREYYREAASWRKKAREAKAGSAEKTVASSRAKEYSALIDRLREELGYVTQEERLKVIQRLEERERKKRRWAESCRRRANYLKRSIKYTQREQQRIINQLSKLPTFDFMCTPEQKERKELLEAQLDRLYEIEMEEKAERKQARLQRKEALAERRQMRAEIRAKRRALRKATEKAPTLSR